MKEIIHLVVSLLCLCIQLYIAAASGGNECNESEISLRIEIKTDAYPSETSWKLVENGVVLYEQPDYAFPNFIFVKSFCLDLSSNCYEYIITDLFNDGMCCTFGEGYYHLYLNNTLYVEGGTFTTSESAFMGETCPTPSPTLSFSPSMFPTIARSNSPTISNHPSIYPSYDPSTTPTNTPSYQPSTNPSLSTQPSLSTIPTQSPTMLVSLLSTHENGRRQYPPPTEYPLYYTWNGMYKGLPNCTFAPYDNSKKRIGCIALPQTILPPIQPWAGKLHTSSSSSSQNQQQQLPMSKYKYKPIGFEDLEIVESGYTSYQDLPGGNLDTSDIILCDVDNDGHSDIIVANMFYQNFLLINKGYGVFQNELEDAIILPGGENRNTKAVGCADIDGDGYMDIIFANWKQPNELLMNQRDGTFQVFELMGGESMATWALALGDVNGDSLIDIVLGNEKEENQLLINQGGRDHRFDLQYLPGGNTSSIGISIGDVNQDNFVDVIIMNDILEPNQILMNSGGAFHHVMDLPESKGMKSRASNLGDVDGDQWIDIVIGNTGQPNYIFRNNGGDHGAMNRNDESLFTNPIQLPGGSTNTRDVQLADVDVDGILDCVIANNGEANVVILNKGGVNFTEPIELPDGEKMTRSMALEDLTKSGSVDIIVGNAFTKNSLIVNRGNSGRYKEDIVIEGIDSTDIIIMDMDHDGYNDVVVINEYDGPSKVFYNKGDATFISKDLTKGNSCGSASTLGDFDGDGEIDLAVVCDTRDPNFLIFHPTNNITVEIELPGGELISQDIVNGDLNGDGLIDLVIGNEFDSNYLLLNQGNRSFQLISLGGDDKATFALQLCDVNNDGSLDIIVGNSFLQPNQLLINRGDGSFENAIELPGGKRSTKSIAVGDIDGDGEWVDIVIGNMGTNQLLLNRGDGIYDKASDLPGSSTDTRDVQIADCDGDGFNDIIFGNYNAPNNILINKKDGVFFDAYRDLPGGIMRTVALSIGDLNMDGYVDIAMSNFGVENKAFMFSPCPNGGAQLHASSWCFRCPPFMGRQTFANANQYSICQECLPDHMQESTVIAEVCSESPCPMEMRQFGEEECHRCEVGTYFDSKVIRTENNTSSWMAPRCVPCFKGQYATESLLAIDSCFDCRAGQYQPDRGQDKCIICEPGEYQPDRGQDKCIPCATGGYCDAIDTCDGGFTNCPAGTFNDRERQSEKDDACIPCKKGTFSTIAGANSSSYCELCPAGSYGSSIGQTSCQLCEKGKYQPLPGQTSCIQCEPGYYADNLGFVKCIPCPYRLGSISGSTTCSFCDENFYLKDTKAEKSAIFQEPFAYCLDCPFNGQCPFNTTISTIGVPPNFWRGSLKTSKLYQCESEEVCVGSPSSTADESRRLSQTMDSDVGHLYCKTGYTGVLCEVCADDNYYFNSEDERCIKCPSNAQVIWQVIIVSILFFLVVSAVCFVLNRFKTVSQVVSNLSLQAKLKVFISFYQLISVLQENQEETQGIYGVKLDDRFKGWFDFLQYFSFDILKYFHVPLDCIGSMESQLIIKVMWPYAFILIIGMGQCASGFVKELREKKTLSQSLINVYAERHMLWEELLYSTISIFYLVLPVVSIAIFDVIKCQAFQTSDNPVAFTSYLVADPSIECGESDETYAALKRIFWAFLIIWPLAIPVTFLLLLISIRKSVESKQITPLANACRFLWADYTVDCLYWDVIEVTRKIFLSGFILFIDAEEGSNKVLRLVIAVVISTLYFGILAISKPYKRKDDLYLAFISNYVIICCFATGVILLLCDSQENCDAFVGIGIDTYKASIIVVFLTIGMTLVSVLLLSIVIHNAVPIDSILVISADSPPILELPEECTNHCFLSFVQSTGDSIANEVALKLQLYLPELGIVMVNKDSKEKLSSCAAIVVVYTPGYFQSKKTQSDINIAKSLGKPVIVLYKGGARTVKKMKAECNKFWCNDIEYLFNNEPICWLSDGIFSAISVKHILMNLLSHLPYYQNNPDELDDGLKVLGEIENVKVETDIKILVSEQYNTDAKNIAEEVKEMLSETESSFIHIRCYDGSTSHDDLGNVQSFDDDDSTSHPDPSGIARKDEEKITTIENMNSFILDGSHIITNIERSMSITSSNMNDSLGNDEDLSLLGSHKDYKEFFLLYLNYETFMDEGDILSKVVKEVMEKNIKIILVYDSDSEVPLDFYLEQIPNDLMNKPYELHNHITVPLFFTEHHRCASLRQILNSFMADDQIKRGLSRRRSSLFFRNPSQSIRQY